MTNMLQYASSCYYLISFGFVVAVVVVIVIVMQEGKNISLCKETNRE